MERVQRMKRKLIHERQREGIEVGERREGREVSEWREGREFKE